MPKMLVFLPRAEKRSANAHLDDMKEDSKVVRLDRAFFARGALDVAPDLLNKVLAVGNCSGRIVETEAYLRDDPASHSFRGKTPRNATMFGPPGYLYVYFTYGMHHCANIVTGEQAGEAVLIRALAPIQGIDEMVSRRRSVKAPRDVANGPGKLCQAMGIGRSDDGTDLCAGGRLGVFDDGVPPPDEPGRGRRIGISVGQDLTRRWWAVGDPHVSHPTPSARP